MSVESNAKPSAYPKEVSSEAVLEVSKSAPVVDLSPTNLRQQRPQGYLSRRNEQFSDSRVGPERAFELVAPGSSSVPRDAVTLQQYTSRPANVEYYASQAAASMEEMLAMETVLARGQLTATTASGSVLYATEVAPARLRSSHVNRVSYVARLFAQWHGSLMFRLYVTKAIFQQTKLVMAFIPGLTEKEVYSMSVDDVVAMQLRAVINPSNDSEATLEVPFISGMNWLGVSESTGVFVVMTFQPIVVTQESLSTIPWVLMVSAPRSQAGLRFRYAVNPGYEITSAEMEIDAYAQTSSRTVEGATALRMSAVAPVGYQATELKSMVPIYIPSSATQSWLEGLADRLYRLNLAPPVGAREAFQSTFQSVAARLPTVWGQGRDMPVSVSANGRWYGTNWNYGATACQPTALFFKIAETQEEAATYSGLYVVGSVYDSGSAAQVSQTMEVVFLDSYEHGWVKLQGTYPWIGYGHALRWLDCGGNRQTADVFAGMKALLVEQLARIRNGNYGSQYLAVYSSLDVSRSGHVKDYLEQAINYMPPEVNGSVCALSLTQAPRGLDHFPLVKGDSRFILSWVYWLFNGDPDTPVGRIVRALDSVLEILVPLVFMYDGQPSPLEISTAWRLQRGEVDDYPSTKRLIPTFATRRDAGDWEIITEAFGLDSIPVAKRSSALRRIFSALRESVMPSTQDP